MYAAFDAVLERVGFDDAVERGGIKSALAVSGLSYGRTLATAASTLIIVVGSAVIAIGGAGVTEMRPYVRRALERADSEASNMKAEAKSNQDSSDDGEIDLRQRQRPLTADDTVSAGGGVGPYDRPAR